MVQGVVDGFLIEQAVEVAAQAHIDNVGAVVHSGINTIDDIIVFAVALFIQDPDAHNADVGSDARAADSVVHGRADDARHMGAVAVFVPGSQADVIGCDSAAQIRMILLNAAVEDGDLNLPAARGDAPGGVSIHRVMHPLIAPAAGILKCRVGVVHILPDPGIPGLLRGRVLQAHGGHGIGDQGIQPGLIVGISRGQGDRHIRGGSHSLGHRGSQKPDLCRPMYPGHQLAAEGRRQNLGIFFRLRGYQDHVLLIVLPRAQTGDGFGNALPRHVFLCRQGFPTEDIVLRQARQAIGQLRLLGDSLLDLGLLRHLGFFGGFRFLRVCLIRGLLRFRGGLRRLRGFLRFAGGSGLRFRLFLHRLRGAGGSL